VNLALLWGLYWSETNVTGCVHMTRVLRTISMLNCPTEQHSRKVVSRQNLNQAFRTIVRWLTSSRETLMSCHASHHSAITTQRFHPIRLIFSYQGTADVAPADLIFNHLKQPEITLYLLIYTCRSLPVCGPPVSSDGAKLPMVEQLMLD